MDVLKLPKNFLIGTSTSPIQIEGGDISSNWHKWCDYNHIKDGSHCSNANDHWNRYENDLKLLEKINVNTYRLGIEWSRIEPREGMFDKEAIAQYRDEILKLKEMKIKPLITLHHFSNPLWVENKGDWENSEIVNYYLRYIEFIVSHLGDLITDWITFNEPCVYLLAGHLIGIWPPGKKEIKSFFKGMNNIITAHIKGYKKIHSIRRKFNFSGETKVGFSKHIRCFESNKNNILNNMLTRLIDYLFHDLIMEGMSKGKYKFPIGFGRYPLDKGKYYDFLAINYYSRDILEFNIMKKPFIIRKTVKTSKKNDLGWEIYPKGLFKICKKYYNKYKMDIYITENGICDNTDKKRIQFIYDHLKEIEKLINEGIPIKGYYYWTFIDNFEWLEGESARFGLVYNNFKNQDRTMKRSGEFFSKVCKDKKITENMMKSYNIKP
ncbi:MAG: glycoside hydrolase family 1 protein [Firmicutes bacterium]|nr:glycoside hydrolase family 1 protein [Bacillota bacterium]